MKFMRKQIIDKTCYLVFDIEDIAARRTSVCLYRAGELQEAIEHADNRGGIVVSANWRGFIACEHVAPTVNVADITDQVMSYRIDEESYRLAMSALSFIRVNSPEGSQRSIWAKSAMENISVLAA